MVGVWPALFELDNRGGGLNTSLMFNVLWTHAVESVGIIGVNVFVLISGYFLVEQRKINVRRVINIILTLMFYNCLFFAIGCSTGAYKFSVSELVYAVIPFMAGRKWFVETYIILLLFIPAINKLIEATDRREHRFIIAIQLAIFSVWPSVLPSPPITDRGYGIINFLTLYFIGSYIRKYFDKKTSRTKLLLIFFVCYCITCISSVLPYLSDREWDYCYLPNIIAAAAALYYFLRLKEKKIKIVNKIASTTFGVYLIHATLYLQPVIYHKWMKTDMFVDSYLQLPHFVLCVTIQFMVCAFIDYIRQKLWNPTVGKLEEKATRFLNNENV